MLRLAHQIATNGVWIEQSDSPDYGELRARQAVAQFLAEDIGSGDAQVVIADNIHSYVNKHLAEECEEGQRVDLRGFPPFNPPFDSMFIEWKSDTGRLVGMWVLVIDSTEKAFNAFLARLASQDDRHKVKYVCFAAAIWSHGGRVAYGGSHMLFYLDEVRREVSLQKSSRDDPFFSGILPVGWMTVGFMNCKNVVKQDVTASEGPSEKWIRRQKTAEIRYHILDINPMKEVLKTEGGIETSGLKKALHICRGHFVTYTEERPLFGHIAGTFWKPAHVRGNEKSGIVDKDYRVNAN